MRLNLTDCRTGLVTFHKTTQWDEVSLKSGVRELHCVKKTVFQQSTNVHLLPQSLLDPLWC